MFHIPAHKNVNNPAAQSTLVDSVYLPTDLAAQIPADKRDTAQVLLLDRDDLFALVDGKEEHYSRSILKDEFDCLPSVEEILFGGEFVEPHKDFTFVKAGSSIGDTELAFGV